MAEMHANFSLDSGWKALKAWVNAWITQTNLSIIVQIFSRYLYGEEESISKEETY